MLADAGLTCASTGVASARTATAAPWVSRPAGRREGGGGRTGASARRRPAADTTPQAVRRRRYAPSRPRTAGPARQPLPEERGWQCLHTYTERACGAAGLAPVAAADGAGCNPLPAGQSWQLAGSRAALGLACPPARPLPPQPRNPILPRWRRTPETRRECVAEHPAAEGAPDAPGDRRQPAALAPAAGPMGGAARAAGAIAASTLQLHRATRSTHMAGRCALRPYALSPYEP